MSRTRVKHTASGVKRLTKRERLMTDTESADLIQSASQALAMVQGAWLIGGRISVR
jgi:hypothetical protein